MGCKPARTAIAKHEHIYHVGAYGIRGAAPVHTFDQLEIFEAVAATNSFTEAAERLALSTACVSRNVALLEARIGVRLFNRSTRHLQITPAGEKFLKRVRQGLDFLQSAVDEVQSDHNIAAGHLKVHLANTFCKNFVLPELAEFLGAYPDLQLEFHVDDVGADLIRDGFDLSVQFGVMPDKGHICSCLGVPPVVLAASPGYLAAKGVPQSIEDLDLHQRLLFGPSAAEPFPWVLSYVGKGDGPTTPVHHKPSGSVFIAGQRDALIHAGVAGLGIFPMDIGSGIKYWKDGLLKIVLPDYEMRSGAELTLLYPHRGLLPVRTRAFIEFVKRLAKVKLRPRDFDPHEFAARASDFAERPSGNFETL